MILQPALDYQPSVRAVGSGQVERAGFPDPDTASTWASAKRCDTRRLGRLRLPQIVSRCSLRCDPANETMGHRYEQLTRRYESEGNLNSISSWTAERNENHDVVAR